MEGHFADTVHLRPKNGQKGTQEVVEEGHNLCAVQSFPHIPPAKRMLEDEACYFTIKY